MKRSILLITSALIAVSLGMAQAPAAAPPPPNAPLTTDDVKNVEAPKPEVGSPGTELEFAL